jgi:hypothetical protein
MIDVLLPVALDKTRRLQFYSHSMARNRPLSIVVLSFGVLAFLLLIITRSALTHSLAPLASSAGYVVTMFRERSPSCSWAYCNMPQRRRPPQAAPWSGRYPVP